RGSSAALSRAAAGQDGGALDVIVRSGPAPCPPVHAIRCLGSAMFLEREAFLGDLESARAGAAAGAGCAVLVCGEAGIGKTTLVERFTRELAERGGRVRVLWGACDALFTPRPLGPLLDIASQSDGPLRSAVEAGADREALFSALLAELSRPAPQTLAVFEDVHWADEATLDLLKFVGRRVRRTCGVVLFTFRDDER